MNLSALLSDASHVVGNPSIISRKQFSTRDLWNVAGHRGMWGPLMDDVKFRQRWARNAPATGQYSRGRLSLFTANIEALNQPIFNSEHVAHHFVSEYFSCKIVHHLTNFDNDFSLGMA